MEHRDRSQRINIPSSGSDYLTTVNVTSPLQARLMFGLMVLDAAGQWHDVRTQTVTREPSRIVWISTPERRGLQHDLNAIRDAYKTQFHQQSVGLIIESGCASF